MRFPRPRLRLGSKSGAENSVFGTVPFISLQNSFSQYQGHFKAPHRIVYEIDYLLIGTEVTFLKQVIYLPIQIQLN
jgi:hypothetical protein